MIESVNIKLPQEKVDVLVKFYQQAGRSTQEVEVFEQKYIQLFQIMMNYLIKLPMVQQFIDTNFNCSSKQLVFELARQLQLKSLQQNCLVYEKGQQNSTINFILSGQVMGFFDKDFSRFSQIVSPIEPLINPTQGVVALCNVRKRVSSMKNFTISPEERLKKEHQKKYGSNSIIFDSQSILEERNLFNQQQKSFTAITIQQVNILELSLESYNNLQALQEQLLKIRKKFLSDVTISTNCPICFTLFLYQKRSQQKQKQEIDFERGQNIITQGEEIQYLYIVIQGELHISQNIYLLDEFQQEIKLPLQISIIGIGEFLNEEVIFKNLKNSEYTATAISSIVKILQIKPELFQRLPTSCKTAIKVSHLLMIFLSQEQLRQRSMRRLQEKQLFQSSEYKNQVMKGLQGEFRKQHNLKKMILKESQNLERDEEINLQKYALADGDQIKTDLESHFRTRITVNNEQKARISESLSNDKYPSINEFVTSVCQSKAFHPISEEQTSKPNAINDRLDFGNGELQKQLKQEHYFRVSKSRIKKSFKNLLTTQNDNYLHDAWNKVQRHLDIKARQDQKFDQLKPQEMFKTAKIYSVHSSNTKPISVKQSSLSKKTNLQLSPFHQPKLRVSPSSPSIYIQRSVDEKQQLPSQDNQRSKDISQFYTPNNHPEDKHSSIKNSISQGHTRNKLSQNIVEFFKTDIRLLENDTKQVRLHEKGEQSPQLSPSLRLLKMHQVQRKLKKSLNSMSSTKYIQYDNEK